MVDLPRVGRIFMYVVGLPCLAVLVYVIVGFELDKKKDMVLFDNQLAAPAEVKLSTGELLETLKPKGEREAVRLVKLEPGTAKKLVVTSGGRVIAEAELAPPPAADDEKRGYRGVFTVGGFQRYVVASLPYGQEEGSDE